MGNLHRCWPVGVCAVVLGGLLALVVGAATAGTVPYPYPIAPTTTTVTSVPYPLPVTPVSKSNPLAKRGMWIWQLDRSSGGSIAAIIARAKAARVKTLMIKSSDGTSMWSQFNAGLVDDLHAAGLKVCAWQYVYGDHPMAEAAVGAQAVKDGADCLLIDAEGEYEGKYVSAQTYITTLRHLIGRRYPVALAGLPYVDYHPAFPYSVFLGPNGAQYNVPQMYWRAIGTTTNAVFAHTYEYNVIYGRPIFPLGQVYDSPPIRQVLSFRELSLHYGASGISWWDWQEADSRYFRAIAQHVGRLHGATHKTPVTLALHAQGDLVIWAQEHLISAGARLTIDGAYGAHTRRAVEAFQAAKELPITGEIDPATWQALLRYQPVKVHWVTRGHRTVARTSRGGETVAVVPPSASLPDRGRDVPLTLGAGRPR